MRSARHHAVGDTFRSVIVTVLFSVFLVIAQFHAGADDGNEGGYYTEEHVFQSRPNPTRERFFGGIGTTGLKARVYPGVILKVEEMAPGSSSEGKFAKGEILTGINGTELKGLNPFVVMGNALTRAEASDGLMVFDVTSADGITQRKQTVTIPVLGAYSRTWPLDCAKSKRIIDEAAAFYADPSKFKGDGIPGALTCLFLLSTGDDKYLPQVKAYFDAFPKDVSQIGTHTWNNGYNGIACGEYYLRTGDKSVLPILQYFCDDAKARQMFDCGWTHWGYGVSPGYVAGGLMNPAGAQVLTTLLLGKECGVNVDETTLLNALRFFYRFAGHGGVAYGDHRGEGGFGSNGKDGMVAAAMRIASGSHGDTTIYQQAEKCLAMAMMDSYPGLAMGHGDEGRGDGIWQGITLSSLMKEKPALYRECMERLTWWHDLSREPGGSIGIATMEWGDGHVGHSGPGIGLSYTAPLRTLRITGAQPTKFSQQYTLPQNLWGTKADQAFLSIDHHPRYLEDGPEEPPHVAFLALGDAYQSPQKDLKSLPRDYLLRNIHHRRYVVRTQAAKALRQVGALDELEKFLSDPDPRLRRAALDGLIDWNYWFAAGSAQISTEQLTPGMLAAITKMLSDPEESWYVVEGALMALRLAPASEIQKRFKLIEPWTHHADWWMRQSAFIALSGLEKDDDLYLEVLPTLLDLATKECHTMPREGMTQHFNQVLHQKTPESKAGALIMAAQRKAVTTSEIKSGVRSQEGAYNVIQAMNFCLRNDPSTVAALALALEPRFDSIGTPDLVTLMGAPSADPGGEPFGLYTVLEKLDPKQRAELTVILYDTYRRELVRRYHSAKDFDHDPAWRPRLLNTIIDLTKLKNPAAGWKPIGTLPPSERVWRFKSIDPIVEKDQLPVRERRRMRDIQLTDDLKDWFQPDYDDSAWSSGRAPIGTALYRGESPPFANQSDWGKGEFIVMRTSFEVDALDFDSYRLSVLTPQGFKIYLNGHEIAGYGWWFDKPHYAPWDADVRRHLKKGTNVLAVYGNAEYDDKTKQPFGQMDCLIEGLKLSDLE
jgi:hypothetical protein